MIKYSVYFVPHLKNRRKILPLRAKLCRKYKNYENMQRPLHMTLTWGVSMHKYQEFENELRELCSKQRPRILKAKSQTIIILKYFWSGIRIQNTPWLNGFQRKIRRLVNKYATKKEKHRFWPHISLVYSLEEKPIDLSNLKPIKNPVIRFNMDRVTICKQQKDGEKYKIFKHLKLGKGNLE